MAVSVNFGKCSDAPNKINKDVSGLGGAKNCELKQPCSIEAPVFIVNSSSVSNTDNYCHCSDFGRYYFITDITPVPGHRKAVTCQVDALKSFAADILSLSVNVDRSESAQFSDIADSGVCTLAKDEVVFKNFSKGLERTTSSGDNYLLVISN